MQQPAESSDNIWIEVEENLKAVAESSPLQGSPSLSLPQIDHAMEMINRLIPAGNVPGVILSGLLRLPGRKLAPEQARHDTNALLASLDKMKDTAVYGTFFAGPAAVIWAYQSLLRLAGKNPEDAFPEGTWQFYVDYALREDTARHTTETHGFDTLFQQHRLKLNQIDRMTAWAMAAITTLHQYNDLLRNEWRERVYTSILCQLLPDHDHDCSQLYRRWEVQRPYRREADAKPRQTYPRYRRAKFDHFLEEEMQSVAPEIKPQWVAQVRQARELELPRYQEQMSILAYLEPGPYGETRRPISLTDAAVGIVYEGQYYLLPACDPETQKALPVSKVREFIAAILAQAEQYTSPTPLMNVDRIRRASWPHLYPQLNPALVDGLTMLRRAPILINFDKRPSHLPLSQIRQAERGIGDHALTIFDTGDTFIFDLSHIFFDGTWGAALAEIITNQASAWGTYLYQLPSIQPQPDLKIPPVALPVTKDDWTLLEKQPRITTEAFAETDLVNFHAIKNLREEFKKRNDLLELTVNDILVLYRVIHVSTYQPCPKLMAILQRIVKTGPGEKAAQTTLTAVTQNRINPAILIPVDASHRTPRDRLHPLSIAIPLEQLELNKLRRETVAALHAYKENNGTYETFDNLQRHYLATLAGIGQFLSRAKEIASTGETHNVGTIKMMAHLPTPVQRLLDKIPNRFEVLNDIIKGREVFSNIGAVSSSSTLTRFMTAKDDNENKHLAWGVLTDAKLNMHITLRDFRPHVTDLVAAGYQDLAHRLTQDYLDAYAKGLNQFIEEILQIMTFSLATPPQELIEAFPKKQNNPFVMRKTL